MTKLSVFSAVFAALIAVAAATTYTTTVTTEISAEQSCPTEIQQMTVTPCMQYVAMGMGMGMGMGMESQEECLQKCCEELRSVSPDCRGDAVRRVMIEMTQTYRKEMMKMRDDKVRELTQKCNLKKSSHSYVYVI